MAVLRRIGLVRAQFVEVVVRLGLLLRSDLDPLKEVRTLLIVEGARPPRNSPAAIVPAAAIRRNCRRFSKAFRGVISDGLILSLFPITMSSPRNPVRSQ